MIHHVKTIISILKHRNNPTKIIFAYILLRTGFNKYVTINLDGYKIHLTQSNLAITLFGDRSYGVEDESFLSKILRKDSTYVDVGANIGTLVLKGAMLVGKDGHVIAIEAHPRTFKILESNLKLNNCNNIELINSAVGNKKGTVYFSDIKADDTNKILTESEKGIKVQIETLDVLLNHINHIDLLKIDVEGFEKQVFEGGKATLNKSKLIFFESYEKNYSNYDYHTGDIISLLNNMGFHVFRIVDNQNVLQLNKDYKSLKCENLIATKKPQNLESEFNINISKTGS